MCVVSQAKARGWCETTVQVLYLIIVRGQSLTFTLTCPRSLIGVYAHERLSPRLTSSLHVSFFFFLQFLLPPFIACICKELVSLGSEARI